MDNYNILAEDTEPECSMPFPDELSKDAMKFELKKNTKFSGIIARVEKEFQVWKLNRLNISFHVIWFRSSLPVDSEESLAFPGNAFIL